MTFDVRQLIDRIQTVVHKETNTILNEASRDFLGSVLMQTWESARRFSPGQDEWLKRHVEALEARNELDERRGYPLGFGPIDISPNEVAKIPLFVQVPCEPYRLIVPSTVAPSVLVIDLVVYEEEKPRSMFLSSSPIPGVAFTESTVGAALTETRADGKIELTVRNISKEKLPFLAMIWAYDIDFAELAKELAEEQSKK